MVIISLILGDSQETRHRKGFQASWPLCPNLAASPFGVLPAVLPTPLQNWAFWAFRILKCCCPRKDFFAPPIGFNPLIFCHCILFISFTACITPSNCKSHEGKSVSISFSNIYLMALPKYVLSKLINRLTLFRPSPPNSISSFMLTYSIWGLGELGCSCGVQEMLMEGLTFGSRYCSLLFPATLPHAGSHCHSLSSNKYSVWGEQAGCPPILQVTTPRRRR